MQNFPYKDDTYKIIGACMAVHRELGKGFNEIVYGDALEIELTDNNINFTREKQFNILYKGNLLPHKYQADFIIEDKIILEIKAISSLTDSHSKQILNYIAVSKLKLGLLINFGEDSLKYKRIIL
ncbi:GxxExxY protein [Tamlana agarivorans]|uniref:GxxExxY protein n=1 Tax=Pseudotamlana agarivorans TaxID=481183 RepID=A0ACC5U7M4_9FLAO|nr:GxxExxY protein [Tamlana agarivorans]MBU2950319.1 GxxExxY protein [Tamlana agarivorans]